MTRRGSFFMGAEVVETIHTIHKRTKRTRNCDARHADRKKLGSLKNNDYQGKFDNGVVASRDYVKFWIDKTTRVDVREAVFFSGEQKLSFVAKIGRIKGALNLPSMRIFYLNLSSERKQTFIFFVPSEAVKSLPGGILGQTLH
ncbi:MAG: hypothetical protein ABFD81_01985 [Syntrophaceae bacterium]